MGVESHRHRAGESVRESAPSGRGRWAGGVAREAAAEGAMAAAAPRSARRGSDALELPCAAPPAPLPQPPRLSLPEPEALLLTPERGGGILRRRPPPAKATGRQVSGRRGRAFQGAQSVSEHVQSAWALLRGLFCRRSPQPPSLRRPQVRFKLASGSEDGRQDPAEPARQEAGGRPHAAAAAPLKTEPGGHGLQLPASALATPAPHSTLALGAEAQALRAQSFDARQAAAELVQRSFVTRCALEARVGEGEWRPEAPSDERRREMHPMGGWGGQLLVGPKMLPCARPGLSSALRALRGRGQALRCHQRCVARAQLQLLPWLREPLSVAVAMPSTAHFWNGGGSGSEAEGGLDRQEGPGSSPSKSGQEGTSHPCTAETITWDAIRLCQVPHWRDDASWQNPAPARLPLNPGGNGSGAAGQVLCSPSPNVLSSCRAEHPSGPAALSRPGQPAGA